jgi:serine/threonine-protein kinase
MRATDATARLPDRYEHVRLIASGGMGQVYRATDDVLGREVAIKLLDDRFASDTQTRKRFEREAWAAAQLSSHPHAITIYDVGECDQRPFIVMEFLSGGSLDDVLRESGTAPPHRALEWLAQAASALDHAHEHGLVHRDVKPANLLLTDDGRVKVADFGVASAAGLDSLTQTGTVIGTAGYLSPEQAAGEPATAASDRYSLGVVGFELLAGSRPYESDSFAAEAAAHVNTAVPRISEIRHDLPPEVDAVFERALAKSPSARFPTCADFVAALRAAFSAAAGETRVIAPPPPAPPAARPNRARSGRGPIVFLLGSAIVAAGVLTAVLLSRSDGTTARPTAVRITVTERGATVLRTVTQAAAPPPTTAAPPPTTTAAAAPTAASRESSPSTALQGYAKMQAGDYVGAIPLLEQAAAGLQGSGSLAEAYNDYNLAFSLAKTQGCSTRVLDLLNASEAIQGHRGAIDELRKACNG